MEMEALKYVGAGIASFGMLGAAIGVGLIFAAFLNGAARNPAAANENLVRALIGAALAEAMGILSFLIVIFLLFV